MAQRRMTSEAVVETDMFLSMTPTAQNLYFHLNMHADDCGLVSNPMAIQRMCNSAADDLKLLIAKGFVIQFDDGVVALVHWNINNQIRKDRFHPSIHQDDFKKLIVDGNKIYKIGVQQLPLDLPNDGQVSTTRQPNGNQMTTNCQPSDGQIDDENFDDTISNPSNDGAAPTWQPDGNQVTTNGKPSLGKYRLDKSSIGKSSLNNKTTSTSAKIISNLYNKIESEKLKQELLLFVNELGEEVVAFAIDSMYENADRPTFKYLRTVLNRYKQQGLNSLAAVKHDDDVYNGKVVVTATAHPQIPLYKLGE
ncbi:DnaD domain protein [Limosilactobacillus albertensis]|uniref:DnaD domain protein n=1 Tax=Limosilactobacillus albertensis TaxID=2759752 RepID=A0A839GZK9_9LACO|nr:DnaD domain protein [Limosilactobacillus albertensis]MBB1122864.1 DnaD domain protein [Limosilactobacillus albertensis]MCD7122449.1 DnaD domain protein [Limosilactobacillus albertensis]